MKPVLHHPRLCAVLIAASLTSITHAQEGDGAADLAQDLANPLATMISLPIQANFDDNIGPFDHGFKWQTNIQPVIPFEINECWNLISRTIIPVTYQEDIFPGSGSQFGLGDVNLSLFLSPKKPTAGGVTWGVGPVLLFPTATDSLLGADQWAAGPSVVALKVQGPWTFGILANHLWSYAGDSNRSDINNTFIQPFIAYNTPTATTISLQSESNYNWNTDEWSIPINLSVSQLVKIGKLPVSLQAGVGYWAQPSTTGPEGFRFRLAATLVLPKS